ncbi:MAG TPA: LuxR C-terminal-related transcriptional regulator [Acidimicrobiia bacterium]
MWDGIQVPYFSACCRFRWLESTLDSEPDADIDQVLEELLDNAERWRAPLLSQLLTDLINEHGIRPAPTPASLYGLTNREVEVLAFLKLGATNREIARDLFISEKTAGVHVSSIIRKMDVANRGQAASRANAEFGDLQ